VSLTLTSSGHADLAGAAGGVGGAATTSAAFADGKILPKKLMWFSG